MWEARILIVDDQPEIHRGFKDLLSPVVDSGIDEINKLAADLFADDSDANNLQFPHYHIDSAFSGKEALEMVIEAEGEGEPYSLIFMDMRMPPGWDGLKTTKEIWKRVPKVEIVICSAYSDFKWADIQKAVGVTDRLLFVKKPFEVVEVQQMAHALTNKWHMARKLEQHIGNLEQSAQRSRGLQDLVFQAGTGVNESATSKEALKNIMALIIRETRWDIGHALIANESDVARLENTDIWQCDSECIDVDVLKVSSDSCDYFKGSGLPGRALDTKEEIWGASTRILQHARKSVVDELGIKALYAFPVVVNSAVPAVLEFFSLQEPSGDQQLREGLAQVMQQLGCSFERHLALAGVLEARTRADIANKAKSDFLASMSHEIRTPITGIVGFTDLLLESDLTRENRDSVEIVKNCSDVLLLLVNDILDLSKIEAGTIDLEAVPFELDDVVYDAVDVVRSRIQSDKVELVVDMPLALPVIVGDPPHLRQVLINILSNAAKFTTAGDIALSLRLSEIGGAGVSLAVVVSDGGGGMTAEQLSHIFDPFKRGDTYRYSNSASTGLGLTISKRLVSLMGGDLQAKSKINVGTEFSFEIYLAVESRATHDLVLERAVGKRAMIIDAHPGASRSLAAQLDSYGLKVTACPDIDDGCEKLLKEDVDMVFVSDSSTTGVIKLLKGASGNTNLKVIDVAVGLKKKSRGDEFDGHIFKPIRPKALRGMLDRLCGAEAQENKIKPIVKGTRAAKILVVEDNVVSQRLVTTLLSRAGHTVRLAVDGRQGVEMASAFDYDIIFMDMELPKLSGIEATKLIRQQQADIPIVAMTANAYAEDRARCLEAGMNDYISKPLRREGILNMIARYCGENYSSRSATVQRILIVEDDEALRKIMHKQMSKRFANAALRLAGDGVAACVQLGSFRPHLMVMDVSMPNMDGPAVVNYLRSSPDFSALKIVVVTGLDQSDTRVRNLRAMGVNRIYQKPLRLEDFLNDMQELLNEDNEDE